MIKKGYIHKNKEDFIKEYMLLFPGIDDESFNEKIKDEIAIIGNNKFNDLYQIGLTKFFMKEELKKILDEKLLKIKLKIKKLIRIICLKNWMKIIKECILLIERERKEREEKGKEERERKKE